MMTDTEDHQALKVQPERRKSPSKIRIRPISSTARTGRGILERGGMASPIFIYSLIFGSLLLVPGSALVLVWMGTPPPPGLASAATYLSRPPGHRSSTTIAATSRSTRRWADQTGSDSDSDSGGGGGGGDYDFLDGQNGFETRPQPQPHPHEEAESFATSPRKTPNTPHDFGTALAIVPPIPDWDRLQRARHFCRDPLFHQCPPALRLFHPFTGTALEVAQAVEELELPAFDVVLDTWVIVPHLEQLEVTWEQQSQASDDLREQNFESHPWTEEDETIRKLIDEEERVGLEKAQARARRLGRSTGKKKVRKATGKERDDDKSESEDTGLKVKKSPVELLQQQYQKYQEFGGPCLLCLEPDMESKELLQELREELATLLGHSTYSSPSSVYSGSYLANEGLIQDYRPLIPIATFESVPTAMKAARRIQGLWGDPLTFPVKDLHVLSSRDDAAWVGEDDYSSYLDSTRSDFQPPKASISASTATTEPLGYTSAAEKLAATLELRKNQVPWGCNAKIMLMEEEMEQDDADNAKMMQQLLDDGQAGGLDISSDFTILEEEEDVPERSEIELFLDNDDDWDEGTQVVIGRTHFFTGEQRTYKGMPASSVVDGKDRSIGDVGGTISGLARRRRTTTRSGAHQWEDGEYGRRDKDYLPWGKREKAQKAERLLDMTPAAMAAPNEDTTASQGTNSTSIPNDDAEARK